MGSFKLTSLSYIAAVLLIYSVQHCSGECTTREHLVDIGCNIIYGNPDGDDDLAGRDPGIKYQIMDITYDYGNTVLINGNDYCVPDQVTAKPLTSCSAVEETYIFSGTESYHNVFSSMLSVDSSYG